MQAPAPRGDFRTNRRILLSLTLLAGLAAGLLLPPSRGASAQVVLTSGVRISQIYTRGGEPGAAFNRDFIEVFNGGPSPVDLNGWSLHLTGVNGSPTTTVITSFVSSRSLILEPGRSFLFGLGGGTAGGAPIPTPDFDLGNAGNFFDLYPGGGRVALLRRSATLPAFTCPQLPADGVEDYVGYGAAACHEGNAPAPAPTLAESVKRAAQGCQDTDNNATDFVLAAGAPRNGQTPAAPCGPVAVRNTVEFAATQFFVDERDGRAQISVSRAGDPSAPASVEYNTADGTATDRRDYTTASGTLRFAPGEQTKTFDVLVNRDAFVEGGETINLFLSNASGMVLGERTHATLSVADGPVFAPAPGGNPSDDAAFFVRQHYHDFLGRAPDEDGLGFWTQGIETCATAECVRVKRVDASAAFFLSIEFQETGYFVYRLYKAALPARALRPRAMPRYREFVRDTQDVGRGVVVGQGDWQAQLAANRRAFLEAFVARAEFQAHYPPSLTPAGYVQKLNLQAGGVLSAEEAAALTAALVAGTETRATALGRVADDPDFVRAELNRAFVLMQYFGYLRRDPDALPDNNYDGFDFWLTKLDQHGGDYHAAEMVRAFIESLEYRHRFGQ